MLSQNTITWIGKIMVHMRDLKGTNRDIQNCGKWYRIPDPLVKKATDPDPQHCPA